MTIISKFGKGGGIMAQEAILKIRKKYGKNALLKGMNYKKGATTKDRNKQIGGHKA